MKYNRRTLLRPYQAALYRYLRQGPAAGLQPALKLGALAVASGMETLDLALVHEQALLTLVLSNGEPASRIRMIKQARNFFAEAIVPMEETHRSALDANIHLSRLNRTMRRRTLDLATSNRELKKEIVRRRVVEETLRQSEQQSVQLLEQSQLLQEQLRLLSRRILSVQEEERKRISRELHDVIAQVLTSINVRLTVLRTDARTSTKGLTQNIARTQRLVEKSVDIVHRFARELRPAVLDDLGLIPALHSFMKNFTKETGIRTTLTAFAGVNKLASPKRIVLYRVAQEALTNVARHANAAQADVSIKRFHNSVRMQIIDNGKSFDADRILKNGKTKRMGLLGMRERVEMVGGRFAVDCVAGKRTTVDALIPFESAKEEQNRP